MFKNLLDEENEREAQRKMSLDTKYYERRHSLAPESKNEHILGKLLDHQYSGEQRKRI